METPSPTVRRKVLYTAVAAVLHEVGIDAAEKQAMETLTELLQCFLTEVGQSAKSYCELSGRTEPIINDLVLTFIDMSVNLNGLEKFAQRLNRTILPLPQAWQPQKQLNMLQAGIKQPHPSYIPNFLPTFPHPHAYIRTPTHKQPVTEYEAIREKAATQKRDMERALTRFLARTSLTDNLFQTEDANIYPLIACKRLYPPYISALLPQDQIFDPEDLEYDPREDTANHQVESSVAPVPAPKIKTEPGRSEANNDIDNDSEMIDGSETGAVLSHQKSSPDNSAANLSEIDNPYLRATKMPRKKLITKINVSNNTCSSLD